MNKQTKFITLIFIAALIIIGLGQIIIRQKSEIDLKTSMETGILQEPDQNLGQNEDLSSQPVFVEIDFNDGKKVNGESKERNVLLVLKDVAKNENLSVETQEYRFGSMVVKIGEKENTNSEFWTYYVNDKAGQIASDYFSVYPGDRVVWKFTKNSQ